MADSTAKKKKEPAAVMASDMLSYESAMIPLIMRFTKITTDMALPLIATGKICRKTPKHGMRDQAKTKKRQKTYDNVRVEEGREVRWSSQNGEEGCARSKATGIAAQMTKEANFLPPTNSRKHTHVLTRKNMRLPLPSRKPRCTKYTQTRYLDTHPAGPAPPAGRPR